MLLESTQYDKLKRILACTSQRQLASDVLGPLMEEVGACSAVFLEFSAAGQEVAVTEGIVSGASERSLDAYRQHYFRHDPMVTMQIVATLPTSERPLVGLGDVVDRRLLMQSEYYNRFLRAVGVDDVMAMLLPKSGAFGETYCIGLHRAIGQPQFDRDDRRRLEGLWPAVAGTIRGLARKSGADAIDAMLKVLDDDHALGVAVFDRQFQPVKLNERARDLLDLYPGGEPRANMQRIMLAARRLAGGKDQIARFDLLDGVTTGQVYAVDERADPARYIAVMTSGEKSRASWRKICDELALTPREIEVCSLITRGLTNDKIALILSISRRTVENHLRTIFAKARVNSRTQLIARLIRAN